jgi:hypothetical protein
MWTPFGTDGEGGGCNFIACQDYLHTLVGAGEDSLIHNDTRILWRTLSGARQCNRSSGSLLTGRSGDRINLRKLSELEVREDYQIKISKSFATLESLNETEDVVNFILTTLGSNPRKRSNQSCCLCCSMYCLCVSVYRTTATGCQPNCNEQIYRIISYHISYHILNRA